MKNKGISLGIIFLIIIIIILAVFVFKNIKLEKNESSSSLEPIANFNVKDIKCKPGQELNIEIELLNDCDFVAANFEYKYDSQNLEYMNYVVGDSIKDGAMTIVNNDIYNEKILIGFVAKPDEEKKVQSGKLIDIKFKVKDNLTKNKIYNKFDSTTLKTKDGTDIKYNVKQGIIEIK